MRFSQGWLVLLLIGLSSCSIAPLPPSDQVSDAGAIESATPPAASLTPSPRSSPAADPTSTESVKIYRLDLQCQWFQSETVELPKDRSIDAAVGKVLANQQNGDFELSGYRVIRRPNGEVIIDFRLAANSKRQFTSLSSCEQQALFGSLRQTLLRNPQWDVKLIRFRHRGAAIVL
ncbi:MAG: sporulation/spore germination protein [Leptolyngbyaceae cyanobacterium SM1_3_5]|nr:sporulation/spore germination protein [Leptolyngbyaceae cyanobacterium SM1_3_5]